MIRWGRNRKQKSGVRGRKGEERFGEMGDTAAWLVEKSESEDFKELLFCIESKPPKSCHL